MAYVALSAKKTGILLIGEIEDDEHDQPDADRANHEYDDALHRADQQSHVVPPTPQ